MDKVGGEGQETATERRRLPRCLTKSEIYENEVPMATSADESRDRILNGAFLLRASPETVFEHLKKWYEAQHKELRHVYDFDPCRMAAISKGAESQLLDRRNEIIDLGLAAWGIEGTTFATLYHRWCSRSANAAWPPQSGTFPYAVLVAILANVNAAKFIQIKNAPPSSQEEDDIIPGEELDQLLERVNGDWRSLLGIPKKDLTWLIEHGDIELLYTMSSNMGLAKPLIEGCAEKIGPYGHLVDDRWVQWLRYLGRNKILEVPAYVPLGEPDIAHGRLHESLVHAAKNCPKTCEASDIFGEIFGKIPNAYRISSMPFVSTKDVDAAISAWNVEIANDDNQKWDEYDALAPAERVQFHLLRLYGPYTHPGDPSRVRRLAAYARRWIGGNDGLTINDFMNYANRDGPAFCFAVSYNHSLWRDKDLSQKLFHEYPGPQDSSLIMWNGRASVEITNQEEDESAKDNWPLPKENEAESKHVADAIEQLRGEFAANHEFLQRKLNRLQRLIFWGGLVLLVLVLSLKA